MNVSNGREIAKFFCQGDFSGYFWNGAKIVSLVDSWKALNKIWDFSHTQAVWDCRRGHSLLYKSPLVDYFYETWSYIYDGMGR